MYGPYIGEKEDPGYSGDFGCESAFADWLSDSVCSQSQKVSKFVRSFVPSFVRSFVRRLVFVVRCSSVRFAVVC